MVFLWFSYGFSYGFPMVFLWFSYGFSYGSLGALLPPSGGTSGPFESAALRSKRTIPLAAPGWRQPLVVPHDFGLPILDTLDTLW